MKRALFTSRNLIGDGMHISRALNQWHRENPDHVIDLLTNYDHVTDIYRHMDVPLNVIVTEEARRDSYDFEHVFDVSKAFEYCARENKHIAEGYAHLLGVTLPELPGQRHLHPIFHATDELIPSSLKGLVLISMFSNSCRSRDKNHPGLPPNKMLPFEKWIPTITFLKNKFGESKLRYLGAPKDRATGLEISEEQYMTGIPLNRLALIMKEATLVITIDNGMSHLASSQDAREILLYPECLSPTFIVPYGNPRLAVMQMDPVKVHQVSVLKFIEQLVKDFGL